MCNKELCVPAEWVLRLGNALLGLLLVGVLASASIAAAEPAEEDAKIAQSLAEMLRDGRAIISDNQGRINDPEIGDKGLSAKIVLDQAVETYKKNTGVDPATIDPASRHGRLLRAMMAAITEVMDINQPTINAKGIDGRTQGGVLFAHDPVRPGIVGIPVELPAQHVQDRGFVR